jgi:hypothetical protein
MPASYLPYQPDARKLHEDVAFRVLGAGNFPAHRTISDFRAFHLQELSELFVQVVRLAREMRKTLCRAGSYPRSTTTSLTWIVGCRSV